MKDESVLRFFRRTCFLFLILLTLVLGSFATPKGKLWAQETPVRPNGAVSSENTGEIFGTVVDAEGALVVGAEITLHRFSLSRIGHWSRWIPVGRPVITDKSGAYRFSLPRGGYCLEVNRTGLTRALCRVRVKGNQHAKIDIVLKRPARLEVQLVDVAGRPVVGARVREFAQRGVNGHCDMTQMDLKSLGVAFPKSDASGRLELASLPAGDVISLAIEHPRLAPVRIEQLAVASGVVKTAVMQPGVVLTFHIPSDNPQERIASAFVDLHHRPYAHPSTITNYEIPFAFNGTARLTVEAGEYDDLVVQHEDFYLTPADSPKSRIGPERNVDLRFELHRRVPARGRILDADTRRPVANALVMGEIVSDRRIPSSDKSMQPPEKWSFAEYAQTDAEGRYKLSLAAGLARVTFVSRAGLVPEEEECKFMVAADGSTVVPDIGVRRLPKVNGFVQNPDGTPAARAVVRLRGPDILETQPVLTDEKGRFQIQPDEVPVDGGTGAREYLQHLVAFDPYRPLAARCDVRLNKPTAVSIKLEPHDVDWPLTAFADELRSGQRGILTPQETRGMAAISLRGRRPPELDGALWINTGGKPRTLASLRGHYVLLDFWFTGCGPCHHDFPSVKLVHELYGDKDVVVIGVHDNSRSPEAVKEHVAQIGLPFAVMVDHADGRTLGPYQSHGCAARFPSYILLNPEGNVLLDDRTIPSPTLRSYKLELIRKYVLAAETAK